MAGENKVVLELSSDEALVLLDWLCRFNALKTSSFEDQAEQRVPWDLEARLVLAARNRVRDPRE